MHPKALLSTHDGSPRVRWIKHNVIHILSYNSYRITLQIFYED